MKKTAMDSSVKTKKVEKVQFKKKNVEDAKIKKKDRNNNTAAGEEQFLP